MRAAAVCLAVVAVACGGGRSPGGGGATAPAVAGEAIERVTQDGPVKATVRLWPAKPRLGDRLTLTLTVEAEAGVRVELPPFGEALGRFAIVEFVPRAQATASGGTLATQRYELEAPMSGRQRIPALRIEFEDGRPGRAGDAGPAVRELLTDELSVEIASLLDGDARKAAAELRPLRGRLPPLATRSAAARLWPVGVAAAALLAVAAVLAARSWRRRRALHVRASAYDVAMRRLAELEARGLPRAAELDGWYVELSAIVRRYLEDRYAIRAPELTTEEFLREAGRAADLATGHREVLSGFLAQCDRVKFAAYVPEDRESREAVVAARRFLEETRLTAAAPGVAPGAAAEAA